MKPTILQDSAFGQSLGDRVFSFSLPRSGRLSHPRPHEAAPAHLPHGSQGLLRGDGGRVVGRAVPEGPAGPGARVGVGELLALREIEGGEPPRPRPGGWARCRWTPAGALPPGAPPTRPGAPWPPRSAAARRPVPTPAAPPPRPRRAGRPPWVLRRGARGSRSAGSAAPPGGRTSPPASGATTSRRGRARANGSLPMPCSQSTSAARSRDGLAMWTSTRRSPWNRSQGSGGRSGSRVWSSMRGLAIDPQKNRPSWVNSPPGRPSFRNRSWYSTLIRQGTPQPAAASASQRLSHRRAKAKRAASNRYLQSPKTPEDMSTRRCPASPSSG